MCLLFFQMAAEREGSSQQTQEQTEEPKEKKEDKN